MTDTPSKADKFILSGLVRRGQGRTSPRRVSPTMTERGSSDSRTMRTAHRWRLIEYGPEGVFS